jgi:hypothetical protein
MNIVMLLESISPVVSVIRCMEEQDGVPLSYPYPVLTEIVADKGGDLYIYKYVHVYVYMYIYVCV